MAVKFKRTMYIGSFFVKSTVILIKRQPENRNPRIE